jgi:hypothetical protein
MKCFGDFGNPMVFRALGQEANESVVANFISLYQRALVVSVTSRCAREGPILKDITNSWL